MPKWLSGLRATILTGFITLIPHMGYAHAETRALLVGAWQFKSNVIMDLAGPENDLSAMETVIRGQGASDVTVLRNDGVSRTAVETALHALGLRSKPGDWIFLYYTGHGALAEAATKGTRDGDTDQFLPLPGFDPDVKDAERFIVDKDFYTWLSIYVPKDVQVLMMADTCHSGTLHRSVDPRVVGMAPRLTLGARNVELGARPAPRFASVLTTGGAEVEASREDLPNLFYVSAARDDQIAWENALPVEGAPTRGFLTWSFEQGLTTPRPDGTGMAADQDGDGTLSIGELGAYLNVQVRMLSGQRQESNTIIPPGREGQGLFATVPPPPARPAAPPLPGLYVADVKARATVTGDYPWRLLTDGQGADFIWDARAQAVLRRTGDVVAQAIRTAPQVRGVIEKWAALEALRPLLSENGGRLMVGPLDNGARYPSGAPVTLTLMQPDSQPPPSAAPRYATLFNIASDGTVQRLFPITDSDGNGLLAAGQSLPVLESQVIAPFGADHVVALVTPQPPDDFRLLLRTVDNQRSAARLVAPIRDLLAKADGQASLSIGELYTGN